MTIGFASDEIDLSTPTRNARLKWVIVVDSTLAPGRVVNAAVCVAAATSARVEGILGPAVVDASDTEHPGLPWIGCSVLGATPDQLAALRTRASASDGTFVADMPEAGQLTRVYQEYLDSVAADAAPALVAVSLLGPKNRIDKLTKGLELLA